MIVIKKSFKFSLNGYEVEEQEAGEFESLPDAVVSIAKDIGVLEISDPEPPKLPESKPEPEPELKEAPAESKPEKKPSKSKKMIKLEQVKKHLRIDHSDEDDYITLLEKAAVAHAEQYLNRKLFADAVPESESNGVVISDDIRAAILLITGHLYENRSDTSEQRLYEVPLASKALLNPYRIINL